MPATRTDSQKRRCTAQRQIARAGPPLDLAVTRIEVLVVLIVALLLGTVFTLMLPHMPGPLGGLSPRTYCAANLHTLSNALYTYAGDNSDMFPIAAHVPAIEEQIGRVTYAPGKIGTHRGMAGKPDAGKSDETDTGLSTTRNLWTLVREGGMSPQTLTCPGSPDVPNRDRNPHDFWDFAKYSEVSYGYQVPYGKHGRPSTARPAGMPVVADKGPYGAALEAGAKHPGVPLLGTNGSPKDWSPWNSPNHGGEGQRVLFADGSAEFRTTPLAGVHSDNIYTRWSDATGGSKADPNPRIHGTPPTSNETPWSDTDTLIYP